MCSFSLAKRLYSCILVTLTLFSCSSPASTDTVVRRERPSSHQVYQQEVLHDGTVSPLQDAPKESWNRASVVVGPDSATTVTVIADSDFLPVFEQGAGIFVDESHGEDEESKVKRRPTGAPRIRSAPKKSRDPASVVLGPDSATTVTAIADHEPLPVFEQDVGIFLEETDAEDNKVNRKPADGNPYLKEMERFESDFPVIKSGAKITLKDTRGRYIAASTECSAEEMVGCEEGEHTGCVKLDNETAYTKSGFRSDHIEIIQIGGTRSDNAVQFAHEVALLSKVLTSNSTHGYYLGVCKASDAHGSNDKLFWFHQAHPKRIMPNVLFTIGWEDPQQAVLRSTMKIVLHSTVANGYLLANTGAVIGNEKELLEEHEFQKSNMALTDNAGWIVELE